MFTVVLFSGQMFFKTDFSAKPVTSEESIYSEVEYIFPKFGIFVVFMVQKTCNMPNLFYLLYRGVTQSRSNTSLLPMYPSQFGKHICKVVLTSAASDNKALTYVRKNQNCGARLQNLNQLPWYSL